MEWCKNNQIEKIICCGDVTNSETLQILSQDFPGEIFLVRGNLEIYQPEEIAPYKNYTYGGRTAIWELGGKKVGVCHESFLIKEILAKKEVPSSGGLPSPEASARQGVASPCKTALPSEAPPGGAKLGVGFNKIDIIFYGHTHKPWIETKDGVQIVNPGTLGGVFSRATFAFWDTEKEEPELKMLDLL